MGLFGLSHATISVPDIEASGHFYSGFGLVGVGDGVFRTGRSGSELRLVRGATRGLLELGIWTDDEDDLARTAARATTAGSSAAVRSMPSAGEPAARTAIRVEDPVTGLPIVLSVRERQQARTAALPSEHPLNARDDAVYRKGQVEPGRLGHIVIGSPDLAATTRFLADVVGMRVTEFRGDVMSFLRCDSDHHNIAVVKSPRHFLHHTSWEVDDVDEVLRGGQRLVAVDPTRNLWGPGRHFYGSNYFWYFRDPAGMFAEYFSDMDEISDQEVWAMKTAGEQGGTHVWGPPHPRAFRELSEADDLVAFGA
jgi:catechol 2,3-dioxygenase-like lactoylglutathione lyase family enzyme